MPTNVDTSLDVPEEEGQGEPHPFPVLNQALSYRSRQRQNPAEMALRERALTDREHLSQQQYELKSQQHELQKVSAMASILKEQMRISDSMEKHRQTMLAVKEVSKIPHDDPEYDTKLLDIQSRYPIGMADPVLQDAVRFRLKGMQDQAEAKAKLQLHKDTETATTEELVKREDALQRGRMQTAGNNESAQQEARMAAKDSAYKGDPSDVMNTAIANGKITGYGEIKEDKFSARPGREGSTHVAVEFQNPKTGAYEVNHLPIDAYKSALAANRPAQEPPAKPAGQEDPNAEAIAWLNANPTDPRASKIKEKLGIK